MKISRYRIYKGLIGGGLGAAVAIAIGTDTPIIALIATVLAVTLSLIVERTNKEIVRDERIMQIAWKATYASFTTMLILAALASLGTVLFSNRLPEYVVLTGAIMGYFICVAVLLQICFYAYFSRKL